MDGTVDYFTAENNVRIFGYKKYCGDGVQDAGEQCDGAVVGTCPSCTNGLVPIGTPACINCMINVSSPYCGCGYPTD